MKRRVDGPAILRAFLGNLLKLQNVERGSIWVKREDGYQCVVAMGAQSEKVEGITIDPDRPSIVGWVIENGKMTTARAHEDSRHYRQIEDGLDVKSQSILCFPLILESGEVYGAVELIDTEPGGPLIQLKTDYLELLEDLVSVGSIALSQHMAHVRQVEENQELREALQSVRGEHSLIGETPAFLRVVEKLASYARVDYPVLITGESGTGKEIFARELHRLSTRNGKPFLVQNCSAIPETLLESELFGHRKGAFTGATADKTGLFEAAAGGTVFLDEIGDMSPNLQARVLRVLQDGEIKPVGSTASSRVDVRVVAATNVDLPEAIAQKRFREDLFYRLNVLPLSVPPLRERKQDIPLLLERFLFLESRKLDRPPVKFPAATMRALTEYAWPGNVRELENFVRHILVVGDGAAVSPEDLPAHFGRGAAALPAGRQEPADGAGGNAGAGDAPAPPARDLADWSWDEMERAYLMALLERNHWNISKAARRAGLNRSTFASRLRRLGISK